VGMDDYSAITQTCETKACLLMCRDSIVHNISFGEALANELQPSGITMTCFCPGATNTDFARRAGGESSRLFKQIGGMSRNGSPQRLSRPDGGKNFGNVRSPQLASSRICPLRPPQDGYRHLGLVAKKVD
jgi:NAD(P)-dependent dehydrogenase (short-subunit alcohol dehydrogenase family)